MQYVTTQKDKIIGLVVPQTFPMSKPFNVIIPRKKINRKMVTSYYTSHRIPSALNTFLTLLDHPECPPSV